MCIDSPGRLEKNTSVGGFSSSEEDLSALALSKCITIIDCKNLALGDDAIVQEIVDRMIEFTAYQASLSIHPGITFMLERYQVTKTSTTTWETEL